MRPSCTLVPLLAWIASALPAQEKSVVDRLAGLWRTQPRQCLQQGMQFLTESEGRAEPAVEAVVRLHVGNALFVLERFGEARLQFDRSLTLGRAEGASITTMHALLALGRCEHRLGNLKDSVSRYEAGIAIASDQGEDEIVARGSNNLAMAYQRRGDYDQAIDTFDRSLTAARKIGMPRLEMKILSNLGTLHNDLGQHRAALDSLHRSREIYREVSGGKEHFRILTNMAVAERGLGNLDRAFEIHRQALALQRAAGEERAVANSLFNMGVIHRESGEQADALRSFEEALAIYRRLGVQFEIAKTLASEARILLDRGQIAAARTALEECRTLADKVDSKEIRQDVLMQVARVHEAEGDHQQALQAVRNARDLELALRSPSHARRLAEREFDERIAALLRGQARARQRTFWIAGILCALFALVAGIAFVRKRRTGRQPMPELIPICASCKSIRDEAGEWHGFEAYMTARTPARFSHGLCPHCSRDYE